MSGRKRQKRKAAAAADTRRMEQEYSGKSDLSILKTGCVSEKNLFVKEMHRITNTIDKEEATEEDIRSAKRDFEQVYDKYSATLIALFEHYADKSDQAGQNRLSAEIYQNKRSYAEVNEKYAALLVETKTASSARSSIQERTRSTSVAPSVAYDCCNRNENLIKWKKPRRSLKNYM